MRPAASKFARKYVPHSFEPHVLYDRILYVRFLFTVQPKPTLCQAWDICFSYIILTTFSVRLFKNRFKTGQLSVCNATSVQPLGKEFFISSHSHNICFFSLSFEFLPLPLIWQQRSERLRECMQQGEDIHLRTTVLIIVLIAGQCTQRPMYNDDSLLASQLLIHFQCPFAGFDIPFKSIIF